MFQRKWALVAMFGMASGAAADIEIDLRPNNGGPFVAGQVLNVEIYFVDDGSGHPVTGGDIHLRGFQIDFTDTSAPFPFRLPPTMNLTPDGFGIHSMFPDLPRPGAVYPLPNPNSMLQFTIPAGGEILIGDIDITVNSYDDGGLDVMNSDDPDPNHGAWIIFGFGLDPDDPVTTWRAHTEWLTGDRFMFMDWTQCLDEGVSIVDPPDAVVDARQPHPVDSLEPKQGIDTITVSAPFGAAVACWSLCEVDDDGSPNGIAGFVDRGDGTYSISLSRPITPGAVTTLTYTSNDGPTTTTSLIAHPGNVNGDSAASPFDILQVIDYLNGAATPPWGLYSTDINHDGAFGSLDVLRVIDLLNGADTFEEWNGTDRPINDGSCP